MQKKIDIQELIKKYLQNECTPEEVEQVISFFRDKENQEELPEVEDVLGQISVKAELKEERGEQIFENVLSIAREKEYQSVKAEGRSGLWKYLVAAVFVGVIGATFFFNQWNNFGIDQDTSHQEFVTLQLEDGTIRQLKQGGDVRLMDESGRVLGEQAGNQIVYQSAAEVAELKYNIITVPYGQRFEVQLSDGTHVHLNSGTSLKYPIQFVKGEKRQVFLSGEAFFDVAKDKEHPFVVNADQLNVQVLGTKFNVSSYSEDATADVVLVEGAVGMYQDGHDLESDSSLLLDPGFKGSFDKESGSLSEKKVVTGVYTSWVNGELVFRNMTFGNILKKLERHYNLEIENKNKVLENETFNANFGEEPVEKVFEYLKTMYGIDYSIQADKVIIE